MTIICTPTHQPRISVGQVGCADGEEMLPLGQPTCLTIPLEGRSPFQMNVAGKSWRQCGQIPTGMLRESCGQCWRNAAKRCLQIIHQARDNHLHTHPPATHICGAGWLCRWRGNASIGIAHLPHNTLRGQVPVPNECRGKSWWQCHGKILGEQCGQIPARKCLANAAECRGASCG